LGGALYIYRISARVNLKNLTSGRVSFGKCPGGHNVRVPTVGRSSASNGDCKEKSTGRGGTTGRAEGIAFMAHWNNREASGVGGGVWSTYFVMGGITLLG
jgi:hypothetical protein